MYTIAELTCMRLVSELPYQYECTCVLRMRISAECMQRSVPKMSWIPRFRPVGCISQTTKQDTCWPRVLFFSQCSAICCPACPSGCDFRIAAIRYTCASPNSIVLLVAGFSTCTYFSAVICRHAIDPANILDRRCAFSVFECGTVSLNRMSMIFTQP